MAENTFNPLGFISTAGGLAAGFAGISSQNDANAKNWALNREMMNFNKMQYYDMKRYNSAYEQVRRLRAAGINPALAMSSGQLGTAGTSLGAPATHPQQPIDIGGFASAVSDIGQLLPQNSLTSSAERKNEAETENTIQDTAYQIIRNTFAADKMISEIDLNKGNAQYLKHNIKALDLANQYNERTLENRVQEQTQELEMKKALAMNQWIVNQHLPHQLEAQISKDNMLAINAYLTGAASLRQAHAAMMHAVNERNAFSAQYGKSEKDRDEYFKNTMNMLLSSKRAKDTEAFKNLYMPSGVNIGSDNFGHFSRTYAGDYSGEFEEWMKDYEDKKTLEDFKAYDNNRKKKKK